MTLGGRCVQWCVCFVERIIVYGSCQISWKRQLLSQLAVHRTLIPSSVPITWPLMAFGQKGGRLWIWMRRILIWDPFKTNKFPDRYNTNENESDQIGDSKSAWPGVSSRLILGATVGRCALWSSPHARQAREPGRGLPVYLLWRVSTIFDFEVQQRYPDFWCTVTRAEK